MSSYDRRTASNPFVGNPDLTKKGWDVGNAVLHEYKALREVEIAVENLRKVHAENAPVWKALHGPLLKADPGLEQLRNMLLSQTSAALWYGIDLKDIPFEKLGKAIEQAIKDCDAIHKNLAEVLP